MSIEETMVPVRIAKLVIGYLNHTLTEQEKDLLDDWVCEREENEEIFVFLIEKAETDKVDLGRLMDQLEMTGNYWRIAELITKEIEGCLSAEEQKELKDWMDTADENQKLYRELVHPANRKYFEYWLEQKLSGQSHEPGLN